jgi:primosomal protein N' (replication factor Y)
VCVAVPRLSLDRPFTYVLSEEEGAGTGSLVSVPFHGRTVKGWVLGPASEVPQGRLLGVRKVRSAVRFFNQETLSLLRWTSERYLAPLATVIERSHPPRVVSEERDPDVAGAVDAGTPSRSPSARLGGGLPGHAPPPAPSTALTRSSIDVLARYGGQRSLLEPGTTTWLRPLPREETDVCAAAVAACLTAGRTAIVLVPEADPVPATAATVLEAFGRRVVLFAGGDDRIRYRTWLDVQAGRFDVVVGTRPAVFSPLRELGLIWISRECHPGHREERSPYHHVREVAMARARLHGAACVLASLSPSADTADGVATGAIRSARAPRAVERAAAPLVETTAPEAEDRSPRLAALLKRARSAALIVSRRGYGVARVCRSCGQPAACAACRGVIVVEGGRPRCRVCRRPGECAVCHGREFGVERGGAERVAQWAEQRSPLALDRDPVEGPHAAPADGRLLVGTAASVKDHGKREVDLVAILDPDRALARAGLHAGEQALATWMEAAAWARPRAAGGRVLAQTRHPGHPAIQALVRWEPLPFLLAEGDRRREAGFPPNRAVFRISGSGGLEGRLREAGAIVIVATPAGDGEACLVAVAPERLAGFRDRVVRLAGEGVMERVEAEPQL